MADRLTLAEDATDLITVTHDQIDLVKRTIAQGATDAELKLYLFDCQRQRVHPLDRLLHFTKRDGKYTPVTSIDLMRIRAAETNDYAGSDDATFMLGPGPYPDSAKVTVWRLVQGQRYAFTATARWSEYYPGDKGGFMWRRMPHTMLSKCAEALALRKGFPRQLAGLYAKEEMDQAGPSVMVEELPEKGTPPPQEAPGPTTKPEVDVTILPPAAPNHEELGIIRPPRSLTPLDLASLPAEVYLIAEVSDAFPPAVARVRLLQAKGPEETLPVFNPAIKAKAEDCCRRMHAVTYTVATGEHGPYIKSLKREEQAL